MFFWRRCNAHSIFRRFEFSENFIAVWHCQTSSVRLKVLTACHICPFHFTILSESSYSLIWVVLQALQMSAEISTNDIFHSNETSIRIQNRIDITPIIPRPPLLRATSLDSFNEKADIRYSGESFHEAKHFPVWSSLKSAQIGAQVF